MITFVFSAGQQRSDTDVPKQISSMVRLKDRIDVATKFLVCPNHSIDANATVFLRGLVHGSRWEVLNPCCPEFKRAIETAVEINSDEPLARVSP